PSTAAGRTRRARRRPPPARPPPHRRPSPAYAGAYAGHRGGSPPAARRRPERPSRRLAAVDAVDPLWGPTGVLLTVSRVGAAIRRSVGFVRIGHRRAQLGERLVGLTLHGSDRAAHQFGHLLLGVVLGEP